MVIGVIDKPLLHQLNIAIILYTFLGEKKLGFQFWSKPGQISGALSVGGKQSGGFQFPSKPG